MIEDGLFTRFPMRAVFGLHNWPALPAGRMALRAGPVMAACDSFEVVITGKGCHGGMPHLGSDAIVAAAAIVSGLQTVVSRTIPPHQPAVVSVTQIQGGETWNVLPEQVVLRGTARSFDAEVQAAIESAVGRLAAGIAAAYGCRAGVDYRRQYPATVNHVGETELAAAAAAAVVGAAAVDRVAPTSTGAEDFAFMLQQVPGCYAWLGSSRGGSGGEPGLHHPRYDFNDDVLAVGASYWVRLAEAALPAA
jgi:hippurate hydrolase